MFAILLVGASCAAIAGMLAITFCRIEREREAAATPTRTEPPPPGRCALCDAPLPRRTTTADVVYELEHRIDAERAEVGRVLQAEPDLAHLYRA